VAAPDLPAVEARIWSLLEPYRAELEEATIYGLPSLRWPGVRAHERVLRRPRRRLSALTASLPQTAAGPRGRSRDVGADPVRYNRVEYETHLQPRSLVSHAPDA
jgi:hypothetical protein